MTSSAAGDTFVVAFDGTLHVPASGTYRFVLDLDWFSEDPHFAFEPLGGSVLRVGDRVVLRHAHAPRAEGTVVLDAGTYPLSLVYHKYWGQRSTVARLAVEGPDAPLHVLNVPGTLPEPVPPPRIAIDVGPEPYVLRSMVWLPSDSGSEKRTHAVSVGSPEGVHYAMDLDAGALLYVWKGPFVDATPMWHSRGTDQIAVPLGSVVRLGGAPVLARLDDRSTAWPDSLDEGAYRFEGYDLDAEGRPTFRYRLDDLDVRDRLVPGDGGLVRTLTVDGAPGRGTSAYGTSPSDTSSAGYLTARTSSASDAYSGRSEMSATTMVNARVWVLDASSVT